MTAARVEWGPPLWQACAAEHVTPLPFPFALPDATAAAREALAGMVCGECRGRQRRAAALAALEAGRAAGWPEFDPCGELELERAALLRAELIAGWDAHCVSVLAYMREHAPQRLVFERRKAQIIRAALLSHTAPQWWARFAPYPLLHVVRAALSSAPARDLHELRCLAYEWEIPFEHDPLYEGGAAAAMTWL